MGMPPSPLIINPTLSPDLNGRSPATASTTSSTIVSADCIFALRHPVADRYKRVVKAGRGCAVARDAEGAREPLKTLPVSGDPEKKQAVAAALAGLESKDGARTDIGDALNEIRKDLEQTKRNLQQLQLVKGEWE